MGVRAILGLEIINVGSPSEGAPWRMTVDSCEDDGTMMRFQLTGHHYNGWPDGPVERTVDDIARHQHGTPERRARVAAELDRLDREAARQIAPIMARLERAQIRATHGEEGVALLDEAADPQALAQARQRIVVLTARPLTDLGIIDLEASWNEWAPPGLPWRETLDLARELYGEDHAHKFLTGALVAAVAHQSIGGAA